MRGARRVRMFIAVEITSMSCLLQNQAIASIDTLNKELDQASDYNTLVFIAAIM